MVPQKRKLMVVSGAVAAAVALAGCAPQGYNASQNGAGATAAPNAQPAGNVVEAEPSASVTAAPPADQVTGGDDSTPQVSDADLTTQLVAKTVPRMGSVVTDEKGWILYRFDKDKTDPAKSECNGECAKIWPPALTDDAPELDGVSSDNVGTVERADGTKQITIGGWPVYRYIGDKKPGKWSGQNVAGTWFVIEPNGKKNLTCLPAVSKPVAPPKDGADSGKDSATGTEYNY